MAQTKQKANRNGLIRVFIVMLFCWTAADQACFNTNKPVTQICLPLHSERTDLMISDVEQLQM